MSDEVDMVLSNDSRYDTSFKCIDISDVCSIIDTPSPVPAMLIRTIGLRTKGTSKI